jgi:hypothetical protein
MTNRACTKNNGDGLLYSILCRDLWDTSPMLCHLSYEAKSVRVGDICWTNMLASFERALNVIESKAYYVASGSPLTTDVGTEYCCIIGITEH